MKDLGTEIDRAYDQFQAWEKDIRATSDGFADLYDSLDWNEKAALYARECSLREEAKNER